jgi:ATPase subunit of ABC transporter with duplicated ATPase domains
VYLEGVGHGYGEGQDATLFTNVDLELRKGQRIGLVGPNGRVCDNYNTLS